MELYVDLPYVSSCRGHGQRINITELQDGFFWSSGRSPCPHHEGVWGGRNRHILNLDNRWGRVATLSSGVQPLQSLNDRLGGLQTWRGQFEKRKVPFLSRHSDQNPPGIQRLSQLRPRVPYMQCQATFVPLCIILHHKHVWNKLTWAVSHDGDEILVGCQWGFSNRNCHTGTWHCYSFYIQTIGILSLLGRASSS